MDKQQIKDLLIQIKVFYPRFEAVEKDGNKYGVLTQTIDSWYRQLGYMEYERALEILDSYLKSENGSKTPNAALWIRGGRAEAANVWHSAWLDERHGVIVWEPEKGKKEELTFVYDQVRQCWTDDIYGYDWIFAGGDE